MNEFRNIPPDIAHPKIKKLAQVYERHRGELRDLNRERYALEQGRGRMGELDVAAAAAAHRAGKPDPGQAHLEAHDARLAEVVRREAVLAEVVRCDAQDLLDAVHDGADDWQRTLDQRSADARAALAAALDQVAAALGELQGSYAVAGWLRHVLDGRAASAMYMPGSYCGLPPGRQQTGESRRAEELLGDIRQLTDTPTARKAAA